MKSKKLLTILGVGAVAAGGFTSCNDDLVEYGSGDIKIFVEEGDAWLHDYPLFLGIEKQNRPQIAMWIEDLDGKYIRTLYVTHKAGTKSWQGNKGNPRKEALPCWNYARLPIALDQEIPDGYTGATTPAEIFDAVTGATPCGNFDVKMRSISDFKQFVVKIEINHSTDWNDYYPEDAEEGDANYSGGDDGSGQPAVVYAATIDLDSDVKQYAATLTGHSSPDGSNGNVYSDLSTLTTATQIIKQITIKIQ
ncbi:MAG: DUF2271 domain-containing protein [Tannerella sp.]|nr:DUF2271 domain-containing protein [Tannerella sp.]